MRCSSIRTRIRRSFEAPLVRLRQWIAEKLHEKSPIFDRPVLAIEKILGFAEVLNIPKAGRIVAPILKDDSSYKYTESDNNCTLCKTWCCMKNPSGDPKLYGGHSGQPYMCNGGGYGHKYGYWLGLEELNRRIAHLDGQFYALGPRMGMGRQLWYDTELGPISPSDTLKLMLRSARLRLKPWRSYGSTVIMCTETMGKTVMHRARLHDVYGFGKQCLRPTLLLRQLVS